MYQLSVPYIELTNMCNLKCTYCYNDSKVKLKQDIMPFGLYESLLEDVVKSNVDSVVLSGGEPFLHPQIVEILAMTFEKGILPIVITNATIINEEIVKCICSNKCNIQITFDDLFDKGHDVFRGKGTFQKNLQFIKLLRSKDFKGKIYARIHVRSSNIENVKKNLSFFSELSIDKVYMATIKEMGRAKLDSSDLSVEDIIGLFQFVANAAFKIPVDIKGVFCGLDEGCPFNNVKNMLFQPRIAPDGKVYPCQLFMESRFSLGNINNESILNIISSDLTKNFISEIQQRKKLLDDSACNSCIVSKWCGKGCPAKCWQIDGNFFHTDGQCEIKKFHYKEYLKQKRNWNERRTIDKI